MFRVLFRTEKCNTKITKSIQLNLKIKFIISKTELILNDFFLCIINLLCTEYILIKGMRNPTFFRLILVLI